jgi:hypothetical protein
LNRSASAAHQDQEGGKNPDSSFAPLPRFPIAGRSAVTCAVGEAIDIAAGRAGIIGTIERPCRNPNHCGDARAMSAAWACHAVKRRPIGSDAAPRH